MTDSDESTPEAEQQGIFKEFLHFLLHEKKYWLIPLIVILLILVGLMVLMENSPIVPFIYPMATG